MTWTRTLQTHEWTVRDLLMALVAHDDVERITAAGLSLADLARPDLAGEAALVELRPGTRRRLAAVFELARRRSRETRASRPRVSATGDVMQLVGFELCDEPVEIFRVVLLDSRNRLLAAPEVSRGTLSTSLVHPREVFRPAILAAAAAVIVVHNHPSGDPEPSPEDQAVTRRLARSGALLGIPVLDHVIVGDGRYISFRDRDEAALQGS